MNRRRASIRLAELAQGLRGCALGMALGLALPAGLAVAQGNPFAPVRYVNNLAISQYEYDQRLLFMQVLRQPGDLPTEAMKALIEDRLRSSVAKQFDVKVSPEQVKAGMEEFASRANLTADQFGDHQRGAFVRHMYQRGACHHAEQRAGNIHLRDGVSEEDRKSVV